MKYIIAAISLIIPFQHLNGADDPHNEAIDEIAEAMRKAWNDDDLPGFISLFHPGNKMRKNWSDPANREDFKKAFEQMRTRLGTMDAHEIGLRIARKSRTVLRIEYSIGGTIPGTIALIETGDGWKISDWNIDGQGEPELKEK